MRTAQRELAYAAIDSERDYQDAAKGNARRHEGDPAVMPVGEAILYIEECVARARAAAYRPDGVTAALAELRKAAALVVRTMEDHDDPFRK